MMGFPLPGLGFRMRPELGLGRLGRVAPARPLMGSCCWGGQCWPRTDGGLGSRWLLWKEHFVISLCEIMILERHVLCFFNVF